MASNGNNGFFARHRLLVVAGAVVLAVVLMASFMSHGDVVPVRTVRASRGSIRSVISTNGKVEPIANFEAHAPAGTTVKRVLIKEGDRVKKGQLLVQLDDAAARSDAAKALAQVRSAQAESSAVESGGNREEVLTLQAQMVKAQADRDAAQRNFEALQRLQQNGAASPGEVKAAQDQLATAEANLKLLQQKKGDRYSRAEISRVDAQQSEAQSAYSAAENVLAQLNIRAPFDGIVYSLPVRPGAYVNPGDLILQLADLSKVVVRAFVDEPDIGRLSPGQRIEVTWDALPGREWQGSIASVPASVKLRGTRNVGETTCLVENKDFRLLPNINVGVTIVATEHQNVLTAPREAVRVDDNQTYVFQITNDALQRRNVQTGISNLTQVEVTAGITDNALLAIAPMNGKPLRDGQQVKVTP